MRYLVIPAYEPDEKLLNLLKDLQSYQSLTIVVVNDGSTSSYNPIFEAASQFSTVLCHKQNYGKGRALKTAFSYITNIKNTLGEGIVITADSDGQHTPLDIFKVGKACEDNPNTLITGERYFTGNVPFRSRFGNTITKYVFSLSTGLSLKDTQCGLRAFSTELLPFLCSIKGERYEYEMNVLLEGAKKIPIKGVPIETVYIDDNRSSHFHPLKDAIKIYKEIFKFAMSSIIGFCVDYIGYALLIFLLAPIPPEIRLIIANVMARLCSATVNYCLNKKFVLYRSTIRDNSDYGDLVIYEDEMFGIIDETQISADQLIQDGVTNLFAFGPTLIKDNTIVVSENEEVGRAMSSNPRTAIGVVDSLHYIVLVSDGRTSESKGLSLYEVADIMQEYGCSTAYNLDGGDSSTMYFNGQIINNPTTNGRKISERSVSDIVYIGY